MRAPGHILWLPAPDPLLRGSARIVVQLHPCSPHYPQQPHPGIFHPSTSNGRSLPHGGSRLGPRELLVRSPLKPKEGFVRKRIGAFPGRRHLPVRQGPRWNGTGDRRPGATSWSSVSLNPLKTRGQSIPFCRIVNDGKSGHCSRRTFHLTVIKNCFSFRWQFDPPYLPMAFHDAARALNSCPCLSGMRSGPGVGRIVRTRDVVTGF